jgi:multiple sugar transport system ATP-binding protein
MAEIVIQDLIKTYPGGSRRATDSVSLTIGDGEFVVLVGPSGCGKTTLLRMVAGLEQPDGGAILMGGRDVTDVPARQRQVSMVFQSYAIFPHMKVRQNIGFGLRMRHVPQSEIDQRVRRVAEILELGEYLDRYPSQLSGGQRQRVAVGRAIAVDAKVLLMDEPLSNLDALLRLQFRAELKRIVRQIKSTTIYVTHDQAEAMSLADRVAVMRDGRIAQVGPPVEVYERPAERFVGGFLGAPPMNFFPAVAHRESGGVVLAVGGHRLAAPPALGAFDGHTVTVGVRAESVEVAAGAGDGRLSARVDVVEPTGPFLLLTVRLDGHEIKVQAPSGLTVSPDSEIWLRFPAQALRYFDTESGMALLA